jgi:uncharacterized surface protein with fasciclin (FAS1) repeats
MTLAAALVACSDDSSSGGDGTSADDSRVTTEIDQGTTGLTLQERVDAATDALGRGDFSTMLRLLTLTTLGNEVEDRAVTILAPNDEAFASLSTEQLADIVANPTQLDDLLRHHILDGALSFDELKGMSEVTTIGGDALAVAASGESVTIDGVVVTELDSELTTGESGQDLAVYEVDEVLLTS